MGVQRKWLGKVGAMVVMLGVVACTFAAVPAVMANAIADGTVVSLTAANDMGKTFDHYIRTYTVPVLGSAVGIAGMTQLGSRPALASGAIAGGIGMLFWPSIMGSGQTQAQASISQVLAWSPQLFIQSGQVLIEGTLGAMGLMALRARRRGRMTAPCVGAA